MVSPAQSETGSIAVEDGPAETPIELIRCPRLGLTWDETITALGPTRDHRCSIQRARVDIDYQVAACLSPAYVDCPVYNGLPVAPAGAAATRVPVPPAPADASASIPAIVWLLPVFGFATGLLLSML